MKKYYDFLVVGSGIAGLSFALKVAEKGKVAIVTKETIIDSNTKYAQGGIAAVVSNEDTFEAHVRDTLIAGDGLCDEEVVRMVITEAPERIKDLEKWGVDFDRAKDGFYDLGKEGGHSKNRILHHKDNTGYEVEKKVADKVLQHPNIDVYEHHFAIDIITQHHLGKLVKRCISDIEAYGVYVQDLKTNKIYTFLADKIYIATGGIGNIYETTTNPPIATGDGIAMLYRAKALINNMEFVQFHPTALYNPGEKPSFLITEALRGAGAILKNQKGEAFMSKYDERKDLAPRDIVARAIDNEMKSLGVEYVYLDATGISREVLETHFPNIVAKCNSLGIDITKDYIPVTPAAHYLCGGVIVDKNGKSIIDNLYVGGESSNTGLHGANRLASNSLLEALVYSHRSAMDAIENLHNHKIPENIPDWDDKGTTLNEEMVLITQSTKELKQIMSYYVGIVRTDIRLKRAFDRLKILYEETEELYKRSKIRREICELRNSINIAYLVIKMAMERKESRGLHYNLDYPHKKN
jgi:L-aspartate oxidase